MIMTREERVERIENVKDLELKVKELEAFFKLNELEKRYTAFQESLKKETEVELNQKNDGITKGKDKSDKKES